MNTKSPSITLWIAFMSLWLVGMLAYVALRLSRRVAVWLHIIKPEPIHR